jgi:vitamin B12 transporter
MTMRIGPLAATIFSGLLATATWGSAQSPASFSDRVLVTASLEQEESRKLPVSAEVIEAAEIEARQVNQIAELLATATGLHVARSGGAGQVTSLFMRGTESDHGLVLWNGIELNNPYFGGFNWAFLPTDGVERVEVIRGPYSALYGSDALGGVVQVITRPREGGGLGVEGGDHGYLRVGLDFGHASERLSVDLVGSHRRGGGEEINDDFDSEDLALRLDWRPRSSLSIQLVSRGNDSRTGIPYGGGQPTPEREIAWREWEMAVPVRAELDSWSLEANLSRVAYDSSFRDPTDPFGFTASDTTSEAYRARGVATYRPGERYWLALGGEVDRAEVDDRSVFGVSLEGARQETRALFGELFLELGAVTLDLGLRQDESDVYGGELSPRLGLVMALGDKTRLRASYGEAFRAPSLGELYYPLSGNPDLEPERGRSIELGAEHERGAWSFALFGFDNRLEQLIDFDFATFRNVNVGRARSRGLEGSVAYRGRLVTARWNGTLLEAEDRDTGRALLRRPEQSSNLVVTVRPGSWSWTFTGTWVGEREDVDPLSFARRMNPSYLRIDLAGSWQASPRLAPTLRLENAADRDYQEVLGFPAPGRTLIGGLRIAL